MRSIERASYMTGAIVAVDGGRTAIYSVFYFGVVQAFRPANTADLKVRTTSESKML
jgi:hypothetical protein